MSADLGSVPAKRPNRQRVRTRARIVAAGSRLLSSQSLDSLTIDDIVDAAKVAKGSFYNHFVDKMEFAQAVLEMARGDTEFKIFAANHEVKDPPRRIVRALCVLLNYTEQHPERMLAALCLSEQHTTAASPVNIGVAADVRQGIEDGRLRCIDLDIGVVTILGMFTVAVRHATDPEVDASYQAVAHGVGAALLRALGVDHGEALSLVEEAIAEFFPENPSA